MKLYNIGKPEELFRKLDSMKGNTQVITPDGHRFDWRSNGSAFKSIVSAMPEQSLSNIEVRTENDQDTVSMIDFLMRGNVG
ncbi:MAG: hypothetical protein IKE30_02375 [Clostridia bacterium]|nr:hypothetical protein [Clostridia bacterium]